MSVERSDCCFHGDHAVCLGCACSCHLKPYWQSPDGAITVYNARWEAVVEAGLVRDIALVHADPTYGIGYDPKGRPMAGGKRREIKAACFPKNRTFPKLEGDDRPFDPAPLLALDRPTISWGANHYASRLPDASCWFSWDKRADSGSDDGSDIELAWTNLGGVARRFVHLWRGTCRASETGRAHLWATQKPEALSAWVFERAREKGVKLPRGALLFVPFMGSFPDYRPALALGLRVIACDVAVEACRIAVGARIGAAVEGYEPPPPAETEQARQASLFGARRA